MRALQSWPVRCLLGGGGGGGGAALCRDFPGLLRMIKLFVGIA